MTFVNIIPPLPTRADYTVRSRRRALSEGV
jgi:hypothetical protein